MIFSFKIIIGLKFNINLSQNLMVILKGTSILKIEANLFIFF